MKNFPKAEENQIILTKQIMNYLVGFDVVIENFVNKCCILSSVNLRSFFLDILEYFNQIPLDMNKTKYKCPYFFTDEMKEKSITSFPLRLCTYYVSHSILTKLIYHLVLRTDLLLDEHYPLIYSTINQILFHEIDEKDSFQLDIINISKWSIVLHKMSKIIPDIIISDAFNHIQSSQLLHSNYHIFILRLYSFLYYPKEIFNNFPLISVTFQHLMSILSSNKPSNQLLIAGNKFIRNFLGYTIQYQQTPELLSLFKDINRCLNKIQNEKCSCNSTLVLFSTLSKDKLTFFPLQKFFSLITRQFPSASHKITDVIKTFISILNGHSYINFFNIEKIDINFFKSAPNRKDKIYIQPMLDIIYSNMGQFKHCQKELGLFLSKVASINFTWFIRKQLNKLIQKDFFQFNAEAVLFSAIIILSNESIIIQNGKSGEKPPNDQLISQFKKSIIDLCQKVMDDQPIDLFRTKCWIFDTNDFTKSLSLNSLNYEIEQIIDHTSLIPRVCNDTEKDVATDILNEIKKQSSDSDDIDIQKFINDIDDSQLRYYQMSPIVHSDIEKVLTLCLLLAQEIELTSPHVFNRIPLYLFSDSPFVSALTIRIIQAFIHVKRDQSVLNALLTLQTFEYEQLYIYGLALTRTVKSLVNCKISLTVNSANSILAWQWILLSAPFSIIRDLGLKLGEIVLPILPYSNFPNVHKFIMNHDEEIYRRSITMLTLSFTLGTFSIDDMKFVKFREVIQSNSYLLYYTFFIHALKVFSMNEDKYPQLNHTMNITHAQAISLINAKKKADSKVDCYFMLNLMALRLATSSVFDKYTSPDQILSLLKQGSSFLEKANCRRRIWFLFYFSVNPCLNLSFRFPNSYFFVDILCFHFRLFINELFKDQPNNTLEFTENDYIRINNYRAIYETNQILFLEKDDNNKEINDNFENNNNNNDKVYINYHNPKSYSTCSFTTNFSYGSRNDNNNNNNNSGGVILLSSSSSSFVSKSEFCTSNSNDNFNLNDTAVSFHDGMSDDLLSIASALEHVINFFDSFKTILKGKVKPIDTVKTRIISDFVLVRSLCNLLLPLIDLFERMRSIYKKQNKSFFLKQDTYMIEEEFPFDPMIWFPFLCSIAIDDSNESPLMVQLADKALSIYLSFVHVPDTFMEKIINFQITLNSKNCKEIWVSLLSSLPSLILPVLIDKKSIDNDLYLLICECFKEPRGLFNDLKELIENLSKSGLELNTFENEFDVAVLKQTGSLIALSFYNLSYEKNDFSCFKIIYQISLFAMSSNHPQSNRLIQIISQIQDSYLNQNLLIPQVLLVKVSLILAAVFKEFTEQYLNKFFEIVAVSHTNSKSDVLSFIQFSMPWFSNVKLCNSETINIVPNCKFSYFTSHSFLKKLFALTFKMNGVEYSFSQFPLPNFSQNILELVTKYELKFVIDFVLREKIGESRSVLIYLTIKYPEKLISYLVDHLRFEFTYFMEIQMNERELCSNMANKILDVFISLLTSHKELITQHLHTLFVYCYVRRSVKSIKFLKEMCKIFNEKEYFDCFKHLLVSEDIINETVREVFFWMLSFDFLNDSLNSIELFQYFTKNQILSGKCENYISDIYMNIKIVCLLLSQCDVRSSLCYRYISELMIVLDSLGSPPIEIAIDLLRCNSVQFSPLFTTSLNIVSSNIEKCQEKANDIFISLITAELTQTIIESIFGCMVKMVVNGFFDFESNADVFLVIIPYFAVNYIKKMPEMDLIYKAFGSEKADMVINSYMKVVESDEPVYRVDNEDFDSLILEMIAKISGEKQFLIFSFFMKVLSVDEYKYFDPIYMISLVLLRNQKPNSELSLSVFSPLSKFFISHQNDIKKINELRNFIQIFEEVDSNLLQSSCKRIHYFPLVVHENKFEFAFNESYPVVLNDFKLFESDLIDELNSFILSIQFFDFIKQEKEYVVMKNQVVENSDLISIDFDFNIKSRIEKINTVLNLLNGKKTYLDPKDVTKIFKVNCSVFRAIDNIDEFLK